MKPPKVVFVPPEAVIFAGAICAPPPPTPISLLKYSKRCPSAFVVVG
jgi:hypothetical protein